MSDVPPRDRFLHLLREAAEQGCLTKLTLGKYRGGEPGLKNVFVRPVTLKAGPHLSFVFRYATKDVTKNHPVAEAVARIESLLADGFRDAHLFTPLNTVQLATDDAGNARLHTQVAQAAPPSPSSGHDRTRIRSVAADAPWLHSLGVTNDWGQPREAMAAKFRQINRFVELMSHLVEEAPLPADRPFQIVDMGCGKGYLTFGCADFFGERAAVLGIESRGELVSLCNRTASEHGLNNLRFAAGTIAEATLDRVDVLIALHACDTATDDALARGVRADAGLLVVSPCCQKELRSQLTAPPVLAGALKHGIFQERQAEFATDALRAMLLEWAGYRTKVFEFVSTEHTAKNLMIAAVKAHPAGDGAAAERIRAFAAFYGIRHQQLARALGFELNL